MTPRTLERMLRWSACAAGSVVMAALLARAWGVAADDAADSSDGKPERTRAALHAAVEKNLGYCRDWLGAKDWKSLRQSAGGVDILAAVLAQRGDDDKWHAAAEGFVAKVSALRAAADEEAAEKCQALIAQLAAANQVLAKLSSQAKPRKKAAGEKATEALRPVMLLLDGTYTDAKAALAAGDVAEAKSMTLVLSELGRLVSNHRADAAWRSAAGTMIRAASEVADGQEADAKTVRQQLRGVYEKCQACHEKQR